MAKQVKVKFNPEEILDIYDVLDSFIEWNCDEGYFKVMQLSDEEWRKSINYEGSPFSGVEIQKVKGLYLHSETEDE